MGGASGVGGFFGRGELILVGVWFALRVGAHDGMEGVETDE